MATYTKYCIPLSKPVLLFFPSVPHLKAEGLNDDHTTNSNDEGYIVQVTIKPANQDIVREMASFFLAQHEITKVVESVVFAHIFTNLPPELRIEGRGYTLLGKRKKWNFGKKLKLQWGEDAIQPCEDKWTFTFELIPEIE